MNKSDISYGSCVKIWINISDAIKVVNSVTSSVTTVLAKGEAVSIIGLGVFKNNKHAARIGRNPRTGAELKLAAKNVTAFSPSIALKEAVNS